MMRTFAFLIIAAFGLAAVGCGEKTEVKEEKKVSTPGGTTTETTSKEIKKTGDNPP